MMQGIQPKMRRNMPMPPWPATSLKEASDESIKKIKDSVSQVRMNVAKQANMMMVDFTLKVFDGEENDCYITQVNLALTAVICPWSRRKLYTSSLVGRYAFACQNCLCTWTSFWRPVLASLKDMTPIREGFVRSRNDDLDMYIWWCGIDDKRKEREPGH
jgi:hypothetical protein